VNAAQKIAHRLSSGGQRDFCLGVMKVSKRQSGLELLRNALLLGAVFTVGSALVGTRAYAQSTPPAPPPAEEAQKKADEKVVVTGSRIKRSEFTSPNPIQVITNEQSILRGQIDAADVLQQSSVAAGAQQINNQLTGFVADGGPGVNTLSLRGLGATRTLVMLNGRRLSPAGTRGSVGAADLNVLPQSVINRFEILKDGASSIYGSDAVAGVVNAITVRNIDGGGINVAGTLPFDGGTSDYRIDGIWGQRYDNGSFLVAAEYYNRSAQTIGDRDITACSQDLVRNLTTDPASLYSGSYGGLLDVIDPATGKPKCFNVTHNVVRIGNSIYRQNPASVLNGGIFQLDLPGLERVGLALGNGNPGANVAGRPLTIGLTAAQKLALWEENLAKVPTDFENFKNKTYIAPVERMSLYTQGEVNISNGITAYGELLYNHRESETTDFRQIFPTMAAANPNNPYGVAARINTYIPADSQQEVNFYRAVLGFKGDLFSLSDYFMRDWSFDIYAQGTLTQSKYTTDFVYADRLAATMGAAACDNALITVSAALPFGNCATLPGGLRLFHPSIVNAQGSFAPFTQAERDFLFAKETGDTTYEQFLISGSIAGTLFDLPAGEVGAVLGFERRYDSIDDTPGFNERNGNFNGQTSAGRTQGSDNVVEAFGEIEIPLLADLALIKNLTVNASTRFTNYDSYGSESTYKFGLDWRLSEEYRVRGTAGTSFRAPALFELFLANQTGFLNQNQIDACIGWDTSTNPNIVANCGPGGLNLPAGWAGVGASATIITGGGAGVLDAETSDAKTVGFVWTPDWLPVSVAVDYFDIVVENQVARFGAANIVFACYDEVPFNSSAFCSLFQRDLAPGPNFGRIIQVNNSFVNLNTQNIEGLDLSFQYKQELEDLDGTLTVDFRGTWTFDQVTEFFDGSIDDFNGEIYANDFVGDLDARFDTGPWTLAYSGSIFSRASNDEDIGDTIFGSRGRPECGTAAVTTPFLQQVCVLGHFKQYAEFSMTHDVSVRWREHGWTAQVGVINIFDELAPTTSAAAGTARVGNAVSISNYDAVGRRLFINLGYAF
jgi:iron complex outermembrane receptor protein